MPDGEEEQQQNNNNKLLDEGEREKEEAGLKLNILKTKFMSSSLIPSWHIDGVGGKGHSHRFSIVGLQNHCGWWLQSWN